MARAKTAPQSVLMALANLAPGADKSALMTTIDAAVGDIIEDVETHGGDGALPSDTIKLVQVTLQFLNACASFKDPIFTRQVKDRARDLESAFEGAIALAKMRKMSAFMEPQVSEAAVQADLSAQLEALAAEEDDRIAKQAMKTVAAESAPATMEQELFGEEAPPAAEPEPQPEPSAAAPDTAASEPAGDGKPNIEAFTEVFGTTLADYFKARLRPLQTSPEKADPLPFMMSADFADALGDAVQSVIVPAMMQKKAMVLVAHGLPEDELTPEMLQHVFEGPRKANRVWMLWDERMESYLKALTTGVGPKGKKGAKKAAKNKPGLMAKLMGKTNDKPDPKAPPPSADEITERDAKQFWKILSTAATKSGFQVPKKTDLHFLQSLFEFDPDKLQDGIQGITQMIRQEAAGQGREGSTVDYLNELMRRTAPHTAEMVTMYAYFNLGMTPKILRAFQISQGRTKGERKERLPYLTRFLPDAEELKNVKAPV